MKNSILNLGKVITKEQQKSILGGDCTEDLNSLNEHFCGEGHCVDLKNETCS